MISMMRCPICDSPLTEGELYNWAINEGLCKECTVVITEEVRDFQDILKELDNKGE